jgi:hypothetical protein
LGRQARLEKDIWMRVICVALLCLTAAAGLTACSKQEDEVGASDFVPPTNQTRADYLDSLDRAFTRMDRDGDGVIVPSEISAQRAALIKVRDSDHDGSITREEFVKGGLARFDRIDANHDGVLTSAERRADKGGGTDTIGNVTP